MIKTKIFFNIFLMVMVLVFSGCGSTNTPEGSYKKIIKAVDKEDWGYVYDNLTERSHNFLKSRLRTSVRFQMTANKDREELQSLKSLEGKELFVKFAGMDKTITEIFDRGDFEVVEISIKENNAILKVKHGEEKVKMVAMIKEEEIWKMQLSGRSVLRPRPMVNKDKAVK